MAETTLRTRIAIKRDTEANLSAKNPILLKGEIFLVDATDGTLKVKIGDGVSTFNALDFQEFLFRGYYFNEKFFKDSTYLTELPKSVSNLYLDINSARATKKCLYYWDGQKFNPTNGEDLASDSVAGIMKLYDSEGNNTDGTMTQRSITEAVKNGVVDEENECLILTHISIV